MEGRIPGGSRRSPLLVLLCMFIGSQAQNNDSVALGDLVQDPDVTQDSIIYYVTAPKTLRSFASIPVSVTIQNSSSSVDVNLQLVRTVWNENDTVVVEVRGPVLPGATRKFALDVDALPSTGSYVLRVKGQDLQGHNFTDQSSGLSVERSNNLIFVQTDKPLYKLGDAVKFRLIAVDLALRPVQVSLDVKIYDPQRNLIQQHLGVNTDNSSQGNWSIGYFEGLLQLASEAPLGEWSIEITSPHEETVRKGFPVEEYVLPRFDVQLKAPDYIIGLQDSFEVTLNANYTFGQPVKGRAVIQVDGPGRWQWELRRDVRLSRNFTFPDFNGTATVRIFVSDVVNKSQDFSDWNSITISANVTEGTTNVERKASQKSVSLKSQPYKLEVVKTTNTFKPGFPYSVTVTAVQHDGRPIPPTTKKLVAKLSQSGSAFGGGYFDEELRSFTVPTNGSVEIRVIPAKEARTIMFKARLGKVKASLSISGFDSPSNSFMQIYPLSKNISVGDTAQFSINLTNPFDQVNYTVISKGRIVMESFVAINGVSAVIPFRVKKEWAPRARLLVYYIRPDSEVVANVIDFEVAGLLQNNVSVSLKPENRSEYAEPGENTIVHVETAPNSFVGMLAMDQSLLLLKQGNDIQESDVVGAVSGFDTDSWSFDNAFGASHFKFPDGRSVFRFLEQAGLVVLSNAAIPGNPKNPDVDEGGRGGGVMYSQSAASYDDDVQTQESSDSGDALMAMPINGVAGAMPLMDTERVTGSAKRSKNMLGGNSEPRLRKDFRETFLFETFNSGLTGIVEFKRQVPDTITSWVCSAFSMNSEVGLGLTKDPSKVRVYRPFFATLNLPFSIIRGETVDLEVLIFNYLNQDQNVVVTLEISGKDVKGNKFVATPRTKTVIVKASDSASVPFPVKPEVVGEIDIKASAVSDMAGDSLVRKLKVKPEGVRQQFNAPLFIDLRKKTDFSADVLIPLPNTTRVEGSEKLVFTAIGDLLGPTIYGIDNLIQLPYGCGEQNLALFAPNVFVMKYLSSSNRLDEETRTRLLRNLRNGYQRQLVFKHYDKSYSAFGDSDPTGSTFLTAFVARSFYQARDFITIDNEAITGALDWLVSQQAENGSFPEVGKVFDRELQGGAGKGTTLTAFVLLSLVEAQSLGNYSGSIENATRYLEGQVKSVMDDPYSLAIVNFALQLAGSNVVQFTSARLETLAVVANGTKHWAKEREIETQTFGKFIWEYKLPAKDIEMTAYALLSAVKNKDIDGGYPILAWLLSKRNEQGGFQTSQDTVVGLQAISEFAQLVQSNNRDISVHVTAEDYKKDFSIAEENALVLQNAEPDRFYDNVHVEATGKGTALVQVSWIYYVRNTSNEQAFSVTVKVNQAKTDITLKVCAKYLKKDASNMAVMEINMPSGYQVDEDEVKKLVGIIPELQRVDVEDDQTKLNLYFDKFSKDERCVAFTGYRLFNVENLQNSNVVVYDYYQPIDKKTTFFNAGKTLH